MRSKQGSDSKHCTNNASEETISRPKTESFWGLETGEQPRVRYQVQSLTAMPHALLIIKFFIKECVRRL